MLTAAAAGAAPARARAVAAANALTPQLVSAVVVDDVASNRELFGRLLARRGVASVFYASDGAEALQLLESTEARGVQCVFLDKEMPVMDGHECVARLRATPGLAHIPIVGVTGNALEEDRLAFVAAGADVVVVKPVHIAAIERPLL